MQSVASAVGSIKITELERSEQHSVDYCIGSNVRFNTAPWTLTWLHRLSLHVSWITRPCQNKTIRLEHYNFHDKLKRLI